LLKELKIIMNTLAKLMLFILIAVTFSSCLFRPRPYHGWYHRHRMRGQRLHRYHHGNMMGGRTLLVKQYRTY
jgi:hypothetical protein